MTTLNHRRTHRTVYQLDLGPGRVALAMADTSRLSSENGELGAADHDGSEEYLLDITGAGRALGSHPDLGEQGTPARAPENRSSGVLLRSGVPDCRPPQGVAQQSPESETLLQIGELAKLSRKTVRAIRLYEDMGLLRPQDRSKGHYRLFSREALVRIRWIAKLQELGLRLGEIQQLVRGHEGSGSAHFAAAKLREVYRAKLAETRSKLRQLVALEAELEASLAYLETCDTNCVPQIPVEGCSCCSRHTGGAHAPDLVAGVRAPRGS